VSRSLDALRRATVAMINNAKWNLHSAATHLALDSKGRFRAHITSHLGAWRFVPAPFAISSIQIIPPRPDSHRGTYRIAPPLAFIADRGRASAERCQLGKLASAWLSPNARCSDTKISEHVISAGGLGVDQVCSAAQTCWPPNAILNRFSANNPCIEWAKRPSQVLDD
jgi:hypothetical protein